MSSPKTIYLKNYRPADFEIKTVDLEFDIFEDYTMVKNTSKFSVHKSVSQHIPTTLQLTGEEMELQSVLLNGQIPKYSVDENFLIIENVPETFTLETIVKINPAANKQLMGLYKSDNIFCTQNEPEGFRRITYHLDRPDVMSVFSCKILADKGKYPVLLSNGNPIESGDLPENRHFVQWQDPFKKPSYLFALVAGDLTMTEDFFVTMSGKKVPLRIFTDKGSGNENRVLHAMESLKKAMEWDEKRFGREYDLDIFMIVAVDAFNAGAMENKGLNIFNSAAILADPETATDSDYKYIERVVAHEYFHNWTGDRITCRDWFQLTLKEGLTVFRDAEFSMDMGDPSVKRIEDAAYMREHQFAEDAGPMAHPIQPKSFIEIENFYTRTVYEKGAEVIRLLQTMYGKEKFRKAMDLYFETFDGQAVTTEDFIWSFEKALGIDLTQFKNSWYAQAGTPVVLVEDVYSPEKKEYILKISQSCPFPKKENFVPYHFPLGIGLLDADGNELKSQLHIVENEKETVVFQNIPSRPIPSLLRNFSAPVKLKYDYSLEENLLLFAHDSDDFNRYEAGQRILRKVITDYKDAAGNVSAGSFVPDAVKLAFRSVLNNENLSEAFRAEALSFPGLFTLVEPFDVYEYTEFYNAKKKVLSEIADFLQEDLLKNYHSRTQKKYSKSDEAMGERALKNACLSYLAHSSFDATELLKMQFETADNMTDSIRALALLSKNGGKNAEDALENFAQKWKENPLVMNKFFAVQAMSERDDVLEVVKKLENHPNFDKTNPNKIRSLFGCFGRNYSFFHAEDGKGYEFIGEKVSEIDRFNQKASSGLAQVFRQYKKLDASRQEKMKVVLEKILDQPKVSPALFEVVSAILR